MAREIVNNLKFKKHAGKFFDPEKFATLLDESYRNTKRADGEMTKKSFSPSSLGYGHGTCPRYWYMAFSGAVFIDDNDAVAVANMAQGTQAHERLQKLIATMPEFVSEEQEIINDYPPIRGFIDLIMSYDGEEVIGEIKTAKQEVWDTRKSEMKSSANHMLQLLTYMKLRNAKEGFFLYENKNTQEIIIIPVSMNDKNKQIIEDVFIWMQEVWDNFQNGDLPMRPAGATKYKMPCTYCPVKKQCWDKGYGVGTVQIELMKVPKI
jgi:CRISPR/Cas system-associated exonuclease Cas4 (RecB family)